MDNQLTDAQKRFTLMLEQHKATVYMVCYMFSKNADEVQDLFQEVLLNLWRGFSNFRGQSDIRTWIYRISLNTCISVGRRKHRPAQVPLSLDIDLFADSDEDTRQIDMLHDRISRLKPFDRAIVLLWLEGLPYDEIGAVIGISPKNVGVRLYRIKEQLKKM